jgi:hypothetical protein
MCIYSHWFIIDNSVGKSEKDGSSPQINLIPCKKTNSKWTVD